MGIQYLNFMRPMSPRLTPAGLRRLCLCSARCPSSCSSMARTAAEQRSKSPSMPACEGTMRPHCAASDQSNAD